MADVFCGVADRSSVGSSGGRSAERSVRVGVRGAFSSGTADLEDGDGGWLNHGGCDFDDDPIRV